MTRPPPRWSAAVPHLATLYLRWSNRNRNGYLGFLLLLVLAGTAGGAVALMGVYLSFFTAMFDRLQRHALAMTVLASIVAAVIVLRQRSAYAIEAPGSWVSALPVSRKARRIEALCLQLAPIIAGLVVMSSFDLLAGAVFAINGMPVAGGVSAWRALFSGASIGSVVGFAIPLSKPVDPHPDSRYVPHRATPSRRPVPSLAGLGIWPIRRMFAMLQPKILSRALMPVLLAVPLGSSAAEAMIGIGLVGAAAALLFLGVSVIGVIRAARRWLKPVPLSLRRLSVVAAWRSFGVMLAIMAIAAWLDRVGRS